jgi:hypothetical protein
LVLRTNRPADQASGHAAVLRATFDQILGSESMDKLPGRFQQRGAGAYTLCESCNSITGHWYGGAYADWAHQAMRIIIGTRAQPSLEYPFGLFPLRVLKQVVCMFFSVNGPLFQQRQTDLVRFVLNRDLRAFPAHVRVYAFYTFSDRSRAIGSAGVLRGLGSSSSNVHVFSEITFPPFGFVMTLGNASPPESRFHEISGFSEFEYRDWRDRITMRLPLMPIYTGFPGDYRTRAQTLADVEESKQWEAKHHD